MTTNIIIAIVIVFIVLLIILFLIRKSAKEELADDITSSQVYVGNLSYSLKDYQLKTIFEDFGDISSVRIIKHPQSRRSKGFGFVTFDSVKSVKKALKMHGKELNGRSLVVRVANPRES